MTEASDGVLEPTDPPQPSGEEELDASQAAAQRRLEEVEAKKTAGNDCVRTGAFEAALRNYGDALALLDGACAPTLTAALASNQALCLLRLECFADAEERASAALVADPAHSKAIYRRGCARLRLGDMRGALDDLQKASRLEPTNREVTTRLGEVRQLQRPPDIQELAVAAGATAALGAADGLYEEKPDLNEGRLAETHREQRQWISSIGTWREILDVSFAEEEGKAQISVYMGLPGLQEIQPNKICVWFTATTLEVRVIELRGENRMWIAQELWGQIDADTSSWKVRRDKLSIKLQKRSSARNWDKWEKLRRI